MNVEFLLIQLRKLKKYTSNKVLLYCFLENTKTYKLLIEDYIR